MSFEWPLALLGLVLVPLALAGYVLAQRRRMRYAARFTNLDLLANVVERTPGFRRHVPPALALLALSALLVGLARPQATMAVPREQATVVLAMDASGSMTATDVAPSRLSAARSAAESFLDELPDKFRTGMVAFASQAQVLAPPTTERTAVRGALSSLQAGGGTAIGDAILRSLELRPSTTSNEAPLSILLLSDGKNSAGTDPAAAAREARAAGVPVFTIALGTADGVIQGVDEEGNPQTIAVPPDHETLGQIAELTGGRFFEAPSEDDLRSVYEEIGSQVGSVDEEQEVTALFAGAGALLLLAGAALSTLWFNRIP